MSEPLPAAFPVLERVETPAWMRSEVDPTEVRALEFGHTGTPRPASSPPEVPEPPPEPEAPAVSPETLEALVELDEERAELEATRASLDAVRRALEQERADLEAAREKFAQAEAELATAQTRALLEAKQTLIDLAVGIAEILVGREIDTDPGLMERLATAAIETFDDADGVELRASRASYERLVEALGAPELEHRGARVPVVLDETIEGDGFMAACGRARVDGRIAPRLEAVRQALHRELRAQREESA